MFSISTPEEPRYLASCPSALAQRASRDALEALKRSAGPRGQGSGSFRSAVAQLRDGRPWCARIPPAGGQGCYLAGASGGRPRGHHSLVSPPSGTSWAGTAVPDFGEAWHLSHPPSACRCMPAASVFCRGRSWSTRPGEQSACWSFRRFVRSSTTDANEGLPPLPIRLVSMAGCGFLTLPHLSSGSRDSSFESTPPHCARSP